MSRKTTPTYVLLNQITLAANTNSVTLSNIPQSYADLVLVCHAQVSSNYMLMQINGDTGFNYNNLAMWGNGSSAASNSNNYSAFYFGWIGNGTTNFISKAQIMDYSATDKHKTALFRNDNVGYSYTDAIASRWANTSAITSIRIFELNTSGTINAGSTFSLYGIAA